MALRVNNACIPLREGKAESTQAAGRRATDFIVRPQVKIGLAVVRVPNVVCTGRGCFLSSLLDYLAEMGP